MLGEVPLVVGMALSATAGGCGSSKRQTTGGVCGCKCQPYLNSCRSWSTTDSECSLTSHHHCLSCSRSRSAAGSGCGLTCHCWFAKVRHERFLPPLDGQRWRRRSSYQWWRSGGQITSIFDCDPPAADTAAPEYKWGDIDATELEGWPLLLLTLLVGSLSVGKWAAAPDKVCTWQNSIQLLWWWSRILKHRRKSSES